MEIPKLQDPALIQNEVNDPNRFVSALAKDFQKADFENSALAVNIRFGNRIILKTNALGGKDINLNEPPKVTLICFYYMPDEDLSKLDALYHKYHGKGLEVLGINMLSDQEAIHSAMRDEGKMWLRETLLRMFPAIPGS